MASQSLSESPWRAVFEEIRRHVGNRRDPDGVPGSINWLRKQMALRGANPNVVRNIIYRNKGKLTDKTALYEILQTLWMTYYTKPLHAPELERLLRASTPSEQEVIQLLGRDKRQVYSRFVSGIQQGDRPKLLITGRPGSGKTLLLDYIQQALEDQGTPLVRLENSQDLASTLTRLAVALGMPSTLIESKLLKVTASSAYAVQADAQADVARSILEHCRTLPHTVIMLHVSQVLGDQHSLGTIPLRLNTPEVARVTATEWLYLNLLAPLSQLANLSLLVSMVNLPTQLSDTSDKFESPLTLSPPTLAEARRYVRGRLPQYSEVQQEALVQQAGRSFEELRTLTLLAEVREPVPTDSSTNRNLEALSQLILTASNERLRDFLAALAVISTPEFPTFHMAALASLRPVPHRQLSALEQAFLDSLPAHPEIYRAFSRQFVRNLRQLLMTRNPSLYRELHSQAANYYMTAALQDPASEAGARYLYHLFEARDWPRLSAWLARASVSQVLLRQIWQAAQRELIDKVQREQLAHRIAARYVQLGSYQHPDVLRAFDYLSASDNPDIRLWTLLKRAEGAVIQGHIDQAERYLEGAETRQINARLNAEYELIQASIARWRSRLEEAARRVNDRVKPHLRYISASDAAGRLIHARVAVWAALIAKDRGDLQQALSELTSIESNDDLTSARVAFQRGDVQMKLGYFEAALSSLTMAVTAAQRSEALCQEQIRYLSRRGALHTLRGELQPADKDFTAALGALTHADSEVPELERDFWRAKVNDERALYLLVTGAHDEAILLLQQSRQNFQHYQTVMAVDASYRLLRNTLRLIVAYAFRGWGRPFRRSEFGISPFTSNTNADLEHARARLNAVMPKILSSQQPSFDALKRQALRVASLILELPARQNATKMLLSLAHYPYQKAEALAFMTAASLDMHEFQEADALLTKAHRSLKQLQSKSESGDQELAIWLQTLELRLRLHNDIDGATAHLLRLLQNPVHLPYQSTLLRCYGETLEALLGENSRTHPALQRLEITGLSDADIRLSEALLQNWHSVSQLVKV
jgi:hypothetical protein